MKKLLQKKGVLISSILSLGLSILMLATASMAWLSMNKETNSNGMELQVEASPNLIISNSTSEIAKATIETINTNSPFSITHATNNDTYKPATHDSTYGTYPAGLKYITNTGAVSISSGLVVGSSEAWGEVENVTSSANPNSQDYYIDFVVYVASYAKPMENVKLKAKIVSATKGGADITSGTLMATSIDLYAGATINETNYRGTLNVANKGTQEVYLFDATNHGGTSAIGTVPLNTADSDNYLTYTLRCYFDGALTSSGIAYVNTATLDTSKVTLGVQIFIED